MLVAQDGVSPVNDCSTIGKRRIPAGSDEGDLALCPGDRATGATPRMRPGSAASVRSRMGSWMWDSTSIGR